MLKTSFTTKSLKKLLLSIDVARFDNIDIGISSSDCEDKTVKRSISKNLNKATGYLTPDASWAFI